MPLQALFVIVATLTLVTLFLVLRSGKIREKYAGLWIVVGLATVILAIWPGLLEAAARLLQVQVPSNLLFFLSILLLLGVALHLSLEVSTLEDESRVLAEEVAILRLEVQGLRGELAPGASEPAEHARDTDEETS